MKGFLKAWLLVVCGVAMVSCKKEIAGKPDPDPVVVDEGKDFGIDKSTKYLSNDAENKLRDSVWIYYKFLSLWEANILPTDFSKIDQSGFVRDNYTQYFERSENVLSFLRGKTPLLPSWGRPIDKFSYINRDGVISGEFSGGSPEGFGFSVFYLGTEAAGKDNAHLYVEMVKGNSPAYKAGVRRGDRILRINGDNNIEAKAGRNAFIIGSLRQGEIRLELEKADGSSLHVSLSDVDYNENPLVDWKVIDHGGEKVGYLPFTSFIDKNDLISDRGGSTKTLRQEFDVIFNTFESQGIDELVVDLRFNGGGYVETAEYLIDKLAPVSANGKVMFTYRVNPHVFNDPGLRSDFTAPSINKTNSLNLSRIYFLVSPHTASASELVINALKPYLDCVLVGTVTWDENDNRILNNTYGKPVGSFPISLMNDAIELNVISFELFNSRGEGKYYNGLTPNLHVNEFSAFYDLGDVKEGMLATALQNMSPTTAGAAKAASSTRKGAISVAKGYSLGQRDASDVGMFKRIKSDLKIE